MVVVNHENDLKMDVLERCCICRKETPYWHESDVALCQECAITLTEEDLPSKSEWCRKEEKLTKWF